MRTQHEWLVTNIWNARDVRAIQLVRESLDLIITSKSPSQLTGLNFRVKSKSVPDSQRSSCS